MSLRFPWTLLGPNACHLNYFILYCSQSFFDFMNLSFSPLLSPPPPLPSFLFLSIRLESGSPWELFQNRMDLNLRSSCLSFPERWYHRCKLLYLAGTFHFVHNLVMSFDTISLDICFDVTLRSFTMLQQKDCFLFFFLLKDWFLILPFPIPMVNEWDDRTGGLWWHRRGQSREFVNTGGFC